MRTAVETETPAPQAGTAVSLTRFSSVASSELACLAGRILLYSFPAWFFIRAFYLADPDIWWHLRIGQWILEHQAVPTTDPFSLDGMDKPWVVYSWLFESSMALLFDRFGLMAIILYELAVRVALAFTLFHTVRNLLPGFWRAAALTAVAVFAMTRIIGPRPGMLTILLIIVLFNILLSAGRTGRNRALWLVPPIFVLWANWHIQFVYGLFVLGVFASEPQLNALFRYRPREKNLLSARHAWLTLAASALATLVSPYGAKVYSTVFLYAGQTGVYNEIVELRAMTFREPQDFVALLLVLGAAMAMGWRREARPLWLILLSTSSFLAFRSVRETWFLAVVAVCVIADGWALPRAESRRATPIRSRILVGIWVMALIVASCRHYGLSRDALEIQVAGNFPESAARFIERERLNGPLFNGLTWGGFLLWRLPHLPVALDGRTNVHGEERILRFSDVRKGKPGWESSPDLARANLVITPRDEPFASLLRFDSRFRIAHEDAQAVVFVRASSDAANPAP